MTRRIRPVPVDAVPTPAQLDAIRRPLSDPGADVVLPVPAHDPVAAERAVAAARIDEPLGPDEDDDADPTLFAVATSGSTGTPRIVLLPDGALRASAQATEDYLDGPAHWLLALGVEHVAGLQVVLRAAAAGTVLQAVPPGGPGFAAAVVTASLEALPVGRRHVSLVPTQLRRLLDDPEGRAALSGYDAVLLGGAAADPGLLTAADDAGIDVVTTYGMSETCGGCVYDGRPLDAVQVDVDAAGVISLAGPVVARGYRGGPGFGGRFTTADVGRWDGVRLTVLGRADDVIVTGGNNVAPAEVEAALRTVPGVVDAAVLGVPDPEHGRVVAALVVGEVDDDTLAAHLEHALPRAARPRRVVRVAAIPRQGIGKLDREAAARLLGDR